jgi:hypothetical protein
MIWMQALSSSLLDRLEITQLSQNERASLILKLAMIDSLVYGANISPHELARQPNNFNFVR